MSELDNSSNGRGMGVSTILKVEDGNHVTTDSDLEINVVDTPQVAPTSSDRNTQTFDYVTCTLAEVQSWLQKTGVFQVEDAEHTFQQVVDEKGAHPEVVAREVLLRITHDQRCVAPLIYRMLTDIAEWRSQNGNARPPQYLKLKERLLVLPFEAGSFGNIWLSVDPKDGSLGVTKINSRENGEATERFRREIQTMGRVGGTTAKLLESTDPKDGHPFLSFTVEHHKARSLEHLLAQKKRLDPSLAVHAVAIVAAKLAKAKIPHRDVKPGNILLGESGEVYVCDFGLSRDLNIGHPSLTTSQERLGSPGYMAPEQWKNAKVDQRADVYALGVTLYELLVGHRPHDRGERETVEDVGARHINEEPDWRPVRLLGLDYSLEKIMRKMVAKNLEQRGWMDEAAKSLFENSPGLKSKFGTYEKFCDTSPEDWRLGCWQRQNELHSASTIENNASSTTATGPISLTDVISLERGAPTDSESLQHKPADFDSSVLESVQQVREYCRSLLTAYSGADKLHDRWAKVCPPLAPISRGQIVERFGRDHRRGFIATSTTLILGTLAVTFKDDLQRVGKLMTPRGIRAGVEAANRSPVNVDHPIGIDLDERGNIKLIRFLGGSEQKPIEVFAFEDGRRAAMLDMPSASIQEIAQKHFNSDEHLMHRFQIQHKQLAWVFFRVDESGKQIQEALFDAPDFMEVFLSGDSFTYYRSPKEWSEKAEDKVGADLVRFDRGKIRRNQAIRQLIMPFPSESIEKMSPEERSTAQAKLLGRSWFWHGEFAE